MATVFSPGALGDNWQSKLVQIQYEGDNIQALYEYFGDLNHIIDDHTCSVPLESPLRSKIIKASAFIIDLGVKKWAPTDAGKILTHHIVEAETESGEIFTLEKGRDCILLQSCQRMNPDAKPIIRLQRNGEERANLDSLERIITDLKPKNTSIFDLLKWLDYKGFDGQQMSRLMEPYHLVDSNCQHFAAHLWHELSKKDYPNPSRFTSEGGYGQQTLV